MTMFAVMEPLSVLFLMLLLIQTRRCSSNDHDRLKEPVFFARGPREEVQEILIYGYDASDEQGKTINFRSTTPPKDRIQRQVGTRA
jgi:hypothetical protein